MTNPDHYGHKLVSNNVFDIVGGATPKLFTVDVKGLRPKRYRVLFGDDGDLIGRDAAEMKTERPHIAIAVRTTLQSIYANGEKGQINERIAV